MQIKQTLAHMTAGVALAALAATGLAACSSPATSDQSLNKPGNSTDTLINAAATEPERSLIPADSSYSSGATFVSLLFSGLSYLNPDGTIVNELATAVVPNPDCTEYDIQIRSGEVFSDGTKLKSDNFIRAWNDAARASNRRLKAGLFAPIEGFSATANQDLTGLQRLSDMHFKVHLTQPTCDFPMRLTDPAFVPLPDSAFDSAGNVTSGFGENPYGYGPYMLAREGAWEHGIQLTLVPNTRYHGPRQAQNSGLAFKFYHDPDQAYEDLTSGALDIDEELPDSAKDSFTEQLQDRTLTVSSAHVKFLAIPSSGHFALNTDEGRLRRAAVSQAINREDIVKRFFNGTREVATDFVTPTLAGHTAKLPGNEVLTYRPDVARSLWDQANQISPWTEGDTFTIARPDNGLNAWIDVALGTIGSTLGIHTAGKSYLDQRAIDMAVTRGDIDSAFLVDWQSPYPGMHSYLQPWFATGGYANSIGYSAPDFDAALNHARGVSEDAAANREYQHAEAILLRDLPVLPLWHAKSLIGWSPQVKDVESNWRGSVQYWKVAEN
ncbi:ABC transporter substrate-binding protein [uncultured Mobiluncus sp.]|uniref:ABC transporter substrate-binding protein n=1 Tax=uncultured Mobiluncus sp. TaxID=293425 RepID=UPI00288ACC75|nr:ABC transporter substrate-binding protein [uncultured Mobiluncus sp.]